MSPDTLRPNLFKGALTRAQKGFSMSRNNPKANEEKMVKMLNAWKTQAPDKSFGGMTYPQFEVATARPLDSRSRLAVLQNQIDAEANVRDDEDDNWLVIARRVVAGVVADPTFGPDSPLYEGFGYTRESERKSGLTRKKTGPPSAPPA
jgi:hypothetical protein